MKWIGIVSGAILLAGCDVAPEEVLLSESDDKILPQHACMNGTWMASTLEITINEDTITQAADAAFFVGAISNFEQQSFGSISLPHKVSLLILLITL